MSNRLEKTDSKPWYKQFWPWFIIAIPGLTVIAGVNMLFLAIRNADTLVDDDYYKSGLALNQRMEKNALAASKNISVELNYLNQAIQLCVQGNSSNQQFELTMQHATLAHFDQHLAFTMSDGDCNVIALDSVAEGNYHFTLDALEEQWRVIGSSYFPIKAPITLHP